MDYKKMIIEMVQKINYKDKGEHLYRIISILDVLPAQECKRIQDYLTELYFS